MPTPENEGIPQEFDGNTIALNAHSRNIHNVLEPQVASDAATKAYVDSIATGIKVKGMVAAVATTNIATLSGLATTIDGVLQNVDSTRVLLTGQTTATQNGIYLVHSGAWTRSTDLAAGSNAAGAYAFVTGGTVYSNSGWICSNAAGSDVVGTNNLVFTQFSAAGQVSATLPLVKTGSVLSLNAATESLPGSMSAADKTKLDGITGSTNSIAKFTSASTLGNSVITDLGNGVVVGTTANYGQAFSAAGGYKHITLGTSYFDGTNYITPNVGTNAVAEIVTDTNGIAFISLPSTGATTRTDSPAAFLALERFRVNNGGTTTTVDVSTGLSAVDNGQFIIRGATNTAYRLALAFDTTLNVGMIQAGRSGVGELPLSLNPKGARVGIGTAAPNNQLSVVGAYTTGNDTIPALGTNGGKFGILNDGGSGNYGMLFGVLNNGNGFIQEQRVDASAIAYSLLLQPNGGLVGIGTTNPTATLHVGGNVGVDVVSLQSALPAGHEMIQAFNDSNAGSQIISRHGGGVGDEALSHANVSGSVNKAPRNQKYCSQYITTSPGTYTQSISLSSFGTNMPGNRSFVATLLFTQHVDSIITSGYAGYYVICGETGPTGSLAEVYISSPGVTAGVTITVPTVSVAVASATQFSFSIANSTWTGAMTGYWQIEVAWVGT